MISSERLRDNDTMIAGTEDDRIIADFGDDLPYCVTFLDEVSASQRLHSDFNAAIPWFDEYCLRQNDDLIQDANY